MFCPRCANQVDTSMRYCSSCGFDLSTITSAGRGGATMPISAAPPQQEDETAIVRDALKEEYDLEKELGRGGMAVVYKARDKQLEREVAVKVLPFSLSFDAEFVERFQREARTAGKLEHPNIIPIYRVGRSGRVIYFVMKFIRGKSLSSVIETGGAMPVTEIKRMLIECARALGYAHKHGIVHRDIKPDNIMFDELGQAIVTDFGIAKAQSGARLTGTGMSIGTPHYMSPEQARAQNLDGRSDVYSLGVVAYQCLTGHVPFDGEDSFSIGYKHIMEELPVPPLDVAEQRDLFAVIQRMMAKKPDDRFQNAEELITALESGAALAVADMSTMPTKAIEPMKPPAAPAKPAAPPIAAQATTPLPRASASLGRPKESAAPAEPPAAPARPARPAPKPRPAPRKSRAPLVAAAVLVVAGGGLGGYLWWSRQQVRPTGTEVAAGPTSAAATPATRGDSVRAQSDTGAATPDTTKAAVTSPPPPPTATRPTTTRPTTTRPPATSTRPPATTTTAPPPAAGEGTLSLSGAIPSNATVRVDGQQKRGTRFKLPAGSHNVEIVAQGFQTWSNRVTIETGRTQTVPVTLAPAATASATPGTTTPGTTTPPTAATGPAAACTSPTVSIANARKQCYDVRPAPRTSPVLPPPPSCSGTVTPANILVQVSATGEVVGQPAVSRRSSCDAFNQAAIAQIQDMTFVPATKGGQPVAAWVVVPMRPARP